MGFMLWYRMYARDAAWYSGLQVKGSSWLVTGMYAMAQKALQKPTIGCHAGIFDIRTIHSGVVPPSPSP